MVLAIDEQPCVSWPGPRPCLSATSITTNSPKICPLNAIASPRHGWAAHTAGSAVPRWPLEGGAVQPKRVTWTDAWPQLPGLPGPGKQPPNEQAETGSWETAISSGDRAGDRFWPGHLRAVAACLLCFRHHQTQLFFCCCFVFQKTRPPSFYLFKGTFPGT